ncbi:MAG: DNA methyltransferase, partial [Pyrinomonadaceae bacterium]
MPRLSQAEIRNNAIAFVHEWKDETRERAESQTFWNEFLEIFGIKRRQFAIFERAVQKNNKNTGAIDLFWRGVLLVEHKSLGKDFNKASSQAFEYLENLPVDELPEYVLISDFAAFRFFNLETKEEIEFRLDELPDKVHLFGAISGYQKREYKEQDPVNIKVALKLGDLHDALLESGYTGHKLEVFLVRLVYCLFADDTGIFLPRSSFLFFLTEKTADDGSNLGAMLAQLFQVLDTAESGRQNTLDDDLKAFPHVNGALFRERMDMPAFSRDMRKLLIEACEFDWGKVSPAIFGSLFQSVMDKEKRRNLGAHYTSEKNILKVIHGLFLDDLNAEFEAVKNNLNKLRQFHDKIAGFKFFDPACGCGNFLVITYREMRRLELSILKQIRTLTGNVQGQMLVSDLSKIDVNSFYGIEYEEFPSEIARVALWLTDHLANTELSAEFGISYFRLPLEHSPNIIHDNALRLNWPRIFDFEFSSKIFVLGNPPFIGKQFRSDEQNEDMDLACTKVPNYRTLDYVCAWYVRATEFLLWNRDHNTQANGSTDADLVRVAFVSTNSITQGEQAGVLWNYLLEEGVRIHFAHRTFKWSNEASGNAGVYCVIIGFGLSDVKQKHLFDYETPQSDSHDLRVKNINPYLIDAPDLVVKSRTKAICDVPEIVFGNMPNDGGFLLLSDVDRRELLRKEPNASKFIRPFVGAYEFINNEKRYCIWLKDVAPTEWRGLPEIVNRVRQVEQARSASRRETTRRLAQVPYLFGEIRQTDADYILIPSVSSENRRYVPIGYLTSETIASNLVLFIPDGSMYHFGVLTSTMHNAWMRQVCGRLESRYRYSNNLVYNNFPWPSEPSDKNRERVERTAQAILDARKKDSNATLADLYDPLTMPKELLDAHRANDEAVDACYG